MTDEQAQAERAMTTMPTTREYLLLRHAEARARRNAAPLGSEAYREAVLEIGEFEIEIAALETGVPASKR